MHIVLLGLFWVNWCLSFVICWVFPFFMMMQGWQSKIFWLGLHLHALIILPEERRTMGGGSFSRVGLLMQLAACFSLFL